MLYLLAIIGFLTLIYAVYLWGKSAGFADGYLCGKSDGKWTEWRLWRNWTDDMTNQTAMPSPPDQREV